MLETQLVRTDKGAVNARILAREVKSDFRRVETASVKMNTNLKSAEGKRLFVRYFNSMQLIVHFISVIARTKLKPKDIERVEDLIKEKMDAVDEDLNKALDGLELLFKHNGINRYATYDTKPLELEVGIISAFGRRFFEMMHKFDETMPLFQTLDIFGVISTSEADIQRFALKRSVRRLVRSTRSLATGLQRRMNEPVSNGPIQANFNHRRDAPSSPSETDGIVESGNGNAAVQAAIPTDMHSPSPDEHSEPNESDNVPDSFGKAPSE